jgi:hypothetical protein
MKKAVTRDGRGVYRERPGHPDVRSSDVKFAVAAVPSRSARTFEHGLAVHDPAALDHTRM